MRIVYFILISILLTLIGFSSYNFWFAICDWTSMGGAVEFLQGCSWNIVTNTVDISWVWVDKVKELVISVAEKVIAFGALFAIGAIVFSGIQYTTSFGDDEKTKKAKMTGIYALTGLVLLLVAFPLVNIIVTFIYSLWS